METHCSDRLARSLVPSNGIDDALSFLTYNVSFVGVQEHFLESMCLLLHQVWHDLITTSPPPIPMPPHPLTRQDAMGPHPRCVCVPAAAPGGTPFEL